jgi:hypothetical protein
VKLSCQLTEHCARKLAVGTLSWLLTIISSSLVNSTAPAYVQASSEARSEHWIQQQLQNGQYKLSQSENEGLYFCSIRGGRVIDVEFERGFVTVIFDDAAPLFFQQAEISEELLRKLTSVKTNRFLTVLCVHSFYRDDWQTRYDENLSVNHKLLDIIVLGQN